MRIIEKTTEFHIEEPTVIAIGKFDGIHLGHKEIFARLFLAKKEGFKTAVFTFDPSPAAFFSRKTVPELTTKEEKRRLFSDMGIDYLVEYPFARYTANIDPTDYVREFLLDKMNGKRIVAGTDVSFGKGGAGDADLLRQLSEELGFSLDILDKVTYEGREISSSYVRDEIMQGNVKKAALLMGCPYFITGIVENGKKLGRKLNMPTANIYPAEEKLLPKYGVYFCNVEIGDGIDDRVYHGITNIGERPSVSDGNRVSVETYLLDFDGNLYQKELKISLLQFKREETQFASVEELKEAVRQDIKDVRAYFDLLLE